MQLIVGNLKMYLDGTEIKNYLDKIKEYEDENIVICPSSIHIPYFLNHKFKVGLQNISDKEKGALTGEISALQGKNLGVSYTIIGHSERRNIFKETNEQINLKIKEALNQKLKVILCVGETLEEKEKNLTENIIRKELEECLKDIKEEIIIAYEPIWSIGTGKIPTNQEIEQISKYIKEEIIKITNKQTKVLYGGSVNPNNIESLKKITNIDGYLIGGSSSKIDEFIQIIKQIDKK